jgi:hypothetical protein
MDDKEKSLFESFADTIKHTFDVATVAAKSIGARAAKAGRRA